MGNKKRINKRNTGKMENLCLRYPGVFEIVFSHLDYKSLLNFRFVSKATKDCVDSDKTLWTRIINKVARNLEEVDNPYLRVAGMKAVNLWSKSHWDRFLDKIPVT